MKQSKKHSQPADVAVPGIDLGLLERLLSFMTEHGLEEFEYAHGDLRIRLKKASAPSTVVPVMLPAVPAPVPSGVIAQQAAPPAAAPSPAPAEPAPAPAQDQHIIKSPIVGTFYAGASPESAPYVRVGDVVEAGQTVCIIEAMKLMNEIEADISGEVLRILVENGQPVEYGEPLFALGPAGNKK
jgi:acetyl-CoA carboxylase biotin carboxyl carrier protein